MLKATLLRLFDKALSIGGRTHTIEDVVSEVRKSTMQLFLPPDESAVVVTQIISHPQCKVLHVFVVAGDFEAAMKLQPEVEAFARANGCTKMTTLGRRGFLKRLPHWGWKPQCVLFTKDVGHG